MFNFLNKKFLISGILSAGILFGVGVSKVNANPDVIYGTWLLEKETTYRCVVDAIKSGARVIDTARSYGNEEAVGEAIRHCINDKIISRDEIKVITKILPVDIENKMREMERDLGNDAENLLGRAVENLFEESFKNLNLEYIDAVLLHDACSEKLEINEVWAALYGLKDSCSGKIKNVGVSNFEPYLLQLLNPAPEVVQNPVFPGLHSKRGLMFGFKESYEWAKKTNVEYQGYKALGHGKLKDNGTIGDIAKNHNCEWPAVCLRYALQRGISPVFSSKKSDHIKSAYENISNIELSNEELDKLDSCLASQEIVEILCAQLSNF